MFFLMRPVIENNISKGLYRLYAPNKLIQGFDAVLINLECFDSVLFEKDRGQYITSDNGSGWKIVSPHSHRSARFIGNPCDSLHEGNITNPNFE